MSLWNQLQQLINQGNADAILALAKQTQIGAIPRPKMSQASKN